MALQFFRLLEHLLETSRRRLWCDSRGRERHGLLRGLSRISATLRLCSHSVYNRQVLYDGWSVMLHEPRQRCRMLARRHLMHLMLTEERRNRLRGDEEIRDYRRRIVWPQRKAWSRAMANDRRSRIIATYHFGDYVHGLSQLAGAEVQGRVRMLIRQEHGSEASRMNLEADYRQLDRRPPRTLLADEVEPLRLWKRLRAGNCSLITFCDLPAGSGVACRVQFLGQPAWFSSGAAQLAVSAGVPVFPVISWHEADRSQLMTGAPIEPCLWQGKPFETAVQQLMQRLISVLEARLRQHPWQWRYLGGLARYFHPPPEPIQIPARARVPGTLHTFNRER